MSKALALRTKSFSFFASFFLCTQRKKEDLILRPHTAVDRQALGEELRLIVRHDAPGAVLVEVPRDLAEGVPGPGELQEGELEQGPVVGLEVDLPAGAQDLPVDVQKIPVGQAALGVAVGGPRVAEVDKDPVRLVRGEDFSFSASAWDFPPRIKSVIID